MFHDPKEIVVDGHATKQITLTGAGEVNFNLCACVCACMCVCVCGTEYMVQV